MIKILISLAVVVLLTCPLQAQKEGVSPETWETVQEARNYMDQGQYKEANRVFREVLSSRAVLPTNLSYWFAETLFMISQYHNSRNFAEKYLEIAGKNGDYYAETLDLIKLLDTKEAEMAACQLCDINGYRYVTCSTCQGTGEIQGDCHFCKGLGEHSCRRCYGEGVLITREDFGLSQYQTCPLCQGTGIEICIVCLGAKKIQGDCPVCYGSGVESSRIICDHSEQAEVKGSY